MGAMGSDSPHDAVLILILQRARLYHGMVGGGTFQGTLSMAVQHWHVCDLQVCLQCQVHLSVPVKCQCLVVKPPRLRRRHLR